MPASPLSKRACRCCARPCSRNPLDYQARYYLAKAYLQFSAVNNDYFDLGVRELKRAARIRGSNKQIALDCAKVFFSLWPLLEDEDKAFAARPAGQCHAGAFLGRIQPPGRDVVALCPGCALAHGTARSVKPEFFGPAADQLVAAAIPMEQRREAPRLV